MKIVWEMDLNHANAVLKILGECTGMSWAQMNPLIAPLQQQTQEQVAKQSEPQKPKLEAVT